MNDERRTPCCLATLRCHTSPPGRAEEAETLCHLADGPEVVRKSTVSGHLDSYLHSQGYHSYILDGDNVRHGLNKDLGFRTRDRIENIRRVGEAHQAHG